MNFIPKSIWDNMVNKMNGDSRVPEPRTYHVTENTIITVAELEFRNGDKVHVSLRDYFEHTDNSSSFWFSPEAYSLDDSFFKYWECRTIGTSGKYCNLDSKKQVIIPIAQLVKFVISKESVRNVVERQDWEPERDVPLNAVRCPSLNV